MARLFYGIGRGFQGRTGFTQPAGGVGIVKSYIREFIRPPFDDAQLFVRKTSATHYRPWPFGSEGPDSGGIVPASQAEAATATDSQTATVIMLATQAEASTATDTQVGNAVYVVGVTEGATATDAQDFATAVVHNVSQADAATATDSTDAIRYTSSTATESATATDATEATYLIVKRGDGPSLIHRNPATGNDIRFKVGSNTLGLQVITATDDHAGCFRFKHGGTVRALKIV